MSYTFCKKMFTFIIHYQNLSIYEIKKTDFTDDVRAPLEESVVEKKYSKIRKNISDFSPTTS